MENAERADSRALRAERRVVEISERPAALSPQQWFNYLSDKAGNAYQALAGGRGVFRLTRAVVDALKAESTPSAA